MHTDNLRAWDVEREAELENQYKLFLKESKLKELANTARQLAEKEEELFFFDNYDKISFPNSFFLSISLTQFCD